MTLERSTEYLQALLRELTRLPKETEWVEFKQNNEDPQAIGEYISALANSAALLGKESAYVVWGVENESHAVVGTRFRPSAARHKQQELESWLLQKANPKIHFRFHEFHTAENIAVAMLEIQAARHTPVQFDGVEYIRVGSNKKRLRGFAEKERELWRIFDRVPFEQQVAAENVGADTVLKLLDYPAYFEMTDTPLPDNRQGILNALAADRMIAATDAGNWSVTNLGAILFAKKLQDFQLLSRKAVRLIQYKGNSKVVTQREIEGGKGYASGFEGLVNYIKALLPSNEIIGAAFREEQPIYPELAIRELVANALIHQDFFLTGTGPMIEIFDTRMEITNPGTPLVDVARFLDSPPRSRNEALASFMRRVNICEERGSGVDKVVFETEFYQLPAPLFETTDEHTRAVLFAHKEPREMDKEERVRACYLHCCLKYVNREPMNNASLRERFGIEERNKAQASKILRETIEDDLIRPYDPDVGVRIRRYVPWWA